MIARFVTDRVAQSFARRQVGGRLRRLPNSNSFVFRFSGHRAYVAKYSVLGLSQTSLLRRATASGAEAVLHAQREYLDGPDHATAVEFRALEHLNEVVPRSVPRPYWLDDGVLVEEFVASNGSALGRLQTRGALSRGLAAAIRELLEAVWAAPRPPADMHAGLEAARSRAGIRETARRKFAVATPYVDELVGILEPRDEGIVRAHLGWVGRWSTDRPPPAQALVVGDAKPEHFLLAREGGVRWLDPSIHVAHPVTDVARMVGRSLLVLLAASTPAQVADRTDHLWRALGKVRMPDGSLGLDWEAEVVDHVLADATNILSTYVFTGASGASRDIGPAQPVASVARELLIALAGSSDAVTLRALGASWATAFAAERRVAA